jgi:hypothetical protein
MAVENFPSWQFPHWRQSLKPYATRLTATKDTDTDAITVSITLIIDSPAAREACEAQVNMSVAGRDYGELTFVWLV